MSRRKKFSVFVKHMNAAKEIMSLTEDYFGLEFKKEKGKRIKVATAKHLCRYLIIKHCKKLTLTDVADLFECTHATVIHSRNSIEGYLSVKDVDICYYINDLESLMFKNLKSVGEISISKNGKTLFASINRELHGLEDNRLDDILRLIKKYKEAYEDVSAIISTPLLQLEDE
jgi:hypothetical protein